MKDCSLNISYGFKQTIYPCNGAMVFIIIIIIIWIGTFSKTNYLFHNNLKRNATMHLEGTLWRGISYSWQLGAGDFT